MFTGIRYSELPPIKPSRYHTSLIFCPSKYDYEPENHVFLPHLMQYFGEENHWIEIKVALEDMSQPYYITSSYQLAKKIISYNRYKLDQGGYWDFGLLHQVINNVFSREDRLHFLEVTLPGMAMLALELPQLLPVPLPLLKTGREAHISLSQLQIASLLAHAFFCTFPNRNYLNNKDFENYPTINFNSLFHTHHGRSNGPLIAKLQCVLNYFKRVTSNPPEGTVTFTRRHITPAQLPSWSSLQTPVRVDGFSVDSRGKIEDEGVNMLQVSFANKKFGGGVLDSGYVQEEIRCITCPEMIVARLFAETLDHNEAFLITGVERYSVHTGYGNSFQFRGNFVDQTPRDGSGRRQCAVVAIDALNFSRPVLLPTSLSDKVKNLNRFRRICESLRECWLRILSYIPFFSRKEAKVELPEVFEAYSQYDPKCIDRELNKAYVGFRNPDKEGELSPVASGNWGCGIFRGDPLLKFVIQLLASSEAGRDLKYFTFGEHTTEKKIEKLMNAMRRGNCTIGDVYFAVSRYHFHGGDLTEYLIRALNLDQYQPEISMPVILESRIAGLAKIDIFSPTTC